MARNCFISPISKRKNQTKLLTIDWLPERIGYMCNGITSITGRVLRLEPSRGCLRTKLCRESCLNCNPVSVLFWYLYRFLLGTCVKVLAALPPKTRCRTAFRLAEKSEGSTNTDGNDVICVDTDSWSWTVWDCVASCDCRGFFWRSGPGRRETIDGGCTGGSAGYGQ